MGQLLEAMKEQGFNSLLLCRRHSPLKRFCRKNGIKAVSLKKKGFKNILLSLQIMRLNREADYDLIHVHDSDALSAALLARAFGVKKPLVISRSEDSRLKRSWLWRKKLNQPAIKAIICSSEKVHHSLSNHIKRKETLRVIHGGIDPARFNVSVPFGRLRREYFIPDSSTLVGNVASISHHKDFPTFLKAAKILTQSHMDIFFLIIGDGPCKKQTVRQIKELGLTEKVKISGSRKDIPELLPQLDVLMYPPINEGFGTPILNAFAAGVPVAATSAGCIPEIIEPGVDGLLSPVGDAEKLAENVLKIISDGQLRSALIRGGKKKLALFTRTLTARKTIKLYQEILNSDVKKKS